MVERLTERARHTLALAEEEARALGAQGVEPGALLVGLALERDGAAARMLEQHDLGVQRIRRELRPPAVGDAAPDQPPLTRNSELVLERAAAESRALGHSYVGTEHILLALALDQEGGAAAVLRDAGLDADEARRGVERVASRRAPSPTGNGHDKARLATAAWLRDVGLAAVPDADVDRLLKAASTAAVDRGEYEFAARDLVQAVLRDERLGPILAGLGASEPAVLAALERSS
jgi:ATP-dependent Clp protease ATP-binding subunit ClpA